MTGNPCGRATAVAVSIARCRGFRRRRERLTRQPLRQEFNLQPPLDTQRTSVDPAKRSLGTHRRAVSHEQGFESSQVTPQSKPAPGRVAVAATAHAGRQALD